MEAEKFHNLMSASCTTKKAGVVIQSKLEGLSQGLMVKVLVWDSWKSQEPGALMCSAQGQEKKDVQENWPFFCLFGPLTPSVDWKSPSHWRGRSSLLRVPVQMQISSRTPSQTHSEIMFYPLARHPLAQSG